jgi:hypothetical protein
MPPSARPGVRIGGDVARGDDSRRVGYVGYVLQGVIGSAASLQPGRGLANGVVVPLDQGLCLLPMTESLFDEVTRRGAVDSRFAQCQRFPPGFDTVLAQWSRQGPVAYVEADFWGGRGTQFAAVWEAGKLVLGPIMDGEDAPPAAVRRSAVSQALSRLGAGAHGHIDEFDAVGLGRHRHVEEWLEGQL